MKPAREASAKKDAVKAPPAVADSETGELSYVARNGLRVVIKNAVMSKSAKEAENKYFPPVDDVIDEYSNRDVKFKTTMSVALFERVVKALKDAGCENVRLDFLTRERGIRFASETDDSFLLGLLMPMQGGKLDDAMPPKPQKDQDDLIIA